MINWASKLRIDERQTSIGFDAAVCLTLFEPWMVNIYNSTTRLPQSIRFIEPGNEICDANITEKMVKPPLVNSGISRQVNSSKMSHV
ncbi:hypothetical protein BDZ94DRAFT_505169 [Collybia nuda]|uniref:Uncharacterized protein n=1 Tax=Collybia nuda TaxID=64659 RepID=A0A9P5Y8R4_9AGAR|nr:hypothetical protein BDZ94DRAFT_505169 [Collybia nuda]